MSTSSESLCSKQSEANTEVNYFFNCDNSLNEGDTLVKVKGVQTLLKPIEKRSNREDMRFLNLLPTVNVYTACQHNYNNEKPITVYFCSVSTSSE